jgi:hypothetical protein
MDIGGQAPVVQGEPAARASRILDEIEGRGGQEKVRRVDRVAGPEAVDRTGEVLRLLESEQNRAAEVFDGLPQPTRWSRTEEWRL